MPVQPWAPDARHRAARTCFIDAAGLADDCRVDYKTDVAADKLERHAPQLAAYRAAWERVTSERVTDAAVVGVR